MGAREVFSFSSSQGDISILENDKNLEIGFITKKTPLKGGSKRGVGTVWLPASLVVPFVESLQSLEIIEDARQKAAAEAAAAAAEEEGEGEES